MRINGEVLIPRTDVFRIRRGDVEKTIPIRAVGADWDLTRTLHLPEPKPTMTFARNSKGELERDSEGRPIQTEDLRDAKYVRDVAAHNGLVMVAYIYAGTVEADGFAWETDKALLASNPHQFYMRLMQEIVDGGLSAGETKAWFLAITRLSLLTQEDVAQAVQSFPHEGRETPGAV